MIEFFLFRHGETDWNKIGRMQGRTDIPLNPKGIEQGRRLHEFFAERQFRVVSSPLGRALQTTRLAFPHLSQQQVQIDLRWAETNMGRAEGLTRPEIISQFGEESWLQWAGVHETLWEARFPGGESKAEVRDRAQAALAEFASRSAPFERWAIGTHGGVIRRLLQGWLKEPREEPIEVPNGSVFLLTYADGHFQPSLEPVFKG